MRRERKPDLVPASVHAHTPSHRGTYYSQTYILVYIGNQFKNKVLKSINRPLAPSVLRLSKCMETTNRFDIHMYTLKT